MIRTAAHRTCRAWAAASLRVHSASPITTTAPQLSSMPPSISDAMTTSTKLAEEEGIRWRFPADDNTKAMLTKVEHGLTQTATFTLNSVTPITHDLVEETFFHLYDKVESLRLCFRPRHGQLWLADMPHRKLDLKSVNGSDLEEQNYLIMDSPFDIHDGPLWKVRLMTCPEDAPCHMPEVKATFPHQCHFLLSIHHAANDGMVIMLIKQLLVNIIDSLLQGLPVDTQQVGELRDDVEVREEEARIRTALLHNPERLLAALKKHVGSKHLPLFIETFGVPNVTNPTTVFLPPVVLDNQLMEKFSNKCHSLGVTINSGFTALVNTSQVETVREAGLERDVYNITTKHAVDSRRLMKNCQNLPLGFHSLPLTQYTVTPRDVKKHFWQYLKHLDIELRDKLKRNYMFEQRVLEAMMQPEEYMQEAQYTRRHLSDSDYMFTNLYSPRTSYQGIGKYVQLTSGGNYMSCHTGGYAIIVGLFSFRGQARFQFGFSTGGTHREVAERCFEKSLAVFHDLTGELD